MNPISFFKSLLGRDDFEEDDYEAQSVPVEEEPEPLYAFNRAMPVEVLKGFEAVLFSGRLSEFDDTKLTIERIPGVMSLPVLEVDSKVVVRGYDIRMEPIILSARVLRSSVLECVLGNLEVDGYANHRRDTRYPLSVTANIYAMDDTLLEHPQPCQVLNISTSGACVLSKSLYSMEQALRLRAELVEKSGCTSYPCQIMRIVPQEDGSFEYGLLFAQLDKRKLRDLMQDIQDIQKEIERKMLS